MRHLRAIQARVDETSLLAAEALFASLKDDPFYLAIATDFANDDRRMREVLCNYFEYSIREGSRIGRLVVAKKPELGAAIWTLPIPEQVSTEKKAKLEFLEKTLGTNGLKHYHKIVAFMKLQAASIVEDSAWYLSIVGVSPTAQGQGVGSRLLSTTIAEANAERATCWLETFSEKSHRFYQRLGFVTMKTTRETRHGRGLCHHGAEAEVACSRGLKS